eukprot:gi/632972401/ref/XP_007902640.1/ PREDICTED: ankyrin repeat domain-containing protein SOWAHC [Callorhinchus milii]
MYALGYAKKSVRTGNSPQRKAGWGHLYLVRSAAASGSPVGSGEPVAGGDQATEPPRILPPVVAAVQRGCVDKSGDGVRCDQQQQQQPPLTAPPALPPAAAADGDQTGPIDRPIAQRVCAERGIVALMGRASLPVCSHNGQDVPTASLVRKGQEAVEEKEEAVVQTEFSQPGVTECSRSHAGLGESFPKLDSKGVEWAKENASVPVDSSNLSVRDDEGRNPLKWDSSENNSAHKSQFNVQEDAGSAGQDVRSKNVSNSMLQSNLSPTQVKTNPDLITTGRSRKHLQRSLTVNRDDRSSSLDNDGFESASDSACPHSESLPNTPRSSRKNFRELMINSSPQLRRSVIYNNPVVAVPTIKLGDAGSRKSDSDTSSLVSSKLDDDDTASVALDPLEHEWMIHASAGRWDSLETLLAADPSLITRKDFVTGFTCIHWAAKHGKPELLAMLVNYAGKHDIRININMRSSGGYTPLHLAAMHGHTEVVKLLSGAYDANADIRDYSGKKAWQYLNRDVSEEVRSLIGVPRISDSESALQNGSGRWRLSKVLPANLTHKLINVPEEDTCDAMPSNAVSRKTSTKMKLNRIRFKTQIIHSTPSLRGTDNDHGPKSPLKLRPKSTIFG